jgi:HEAT repeat protein
MSETEQLSKLLKLLDSDNLDDGVAAAQALGEIGDENTLRLLRERLAAVSKEHYALVVAVGKLKKRLGVK